jgi:hypothetical protein
MKLRFALALFVLSLGAWLPRPVLAIAGCPTSCDTVCAGTRCLDGATYEAACCSGTCECNCNVANQPSCTS